MSISFCDNRGSFAHSPCFGSALHGVIAEVDENYVPLRHKGKVMGDEIKADGGITFQVKFPAPVEAYLLKNGEIIQNARKEAFTFTTDEPGVYRVEAYRHYLGRRRGWIFSNPVYVK